MNCPCVYKVLKPFVVKIPLLMIGVFNLCQTSCCATSMERLTTPQALLTDCIPPETRQITTNGELLQAYWEALTAYEECNARYSALREYLNGK